MDAPSIRSICCIGAGYVGGPTMAVVADRCPHIQVTVVDLNAERIGAWNSADLSLLPIYEPGLDEVVGRARGRNLHFTTSVEGAIATADMVFISVNTPTKTQGVGAGQASDLKWIEASARMLAKAATGHTIVVEKSTLPVRTAQAVKSILEAGPAGKSFAVLSNPEFLAEGSAIRDLENPDRVLIGGECQEAIEALAGIYGHWVAPEKILRTNLWSSELSKLTANAFLAQRISSINSIAALCEATGADVREVANAIGADSRIGPKFLKAGPGFGGSCFQKDILNLVYLCRYYGLEDVASYWEQVVTLNTWQQHRISRLMVNRLFGTISGKRIAVLGFAFKADTNDTRESPAIQVCLDLLEEGACLAIVDPKVGKGQISIDLGKPAGQGEGNWQLVDSVEAAAEGADALVLLTEWQQFGQINWPAVAALMRQPAWLFDSRAKADGAAARAAGLNVWTLGEG
ncbi:nucleotide sugar dehydrogenase [Cyanobium sp. BA20m-14]|uniref:nucleotide sugar dehydrogenase n=1 Tax=Cyanobium sp. BA20m-14 TaxID=2823703 RepID=UPI0020CE419B|nr:nucleotide sugar dehydrogenase [Cyanobium sp. BA20m-14]MCP9912619.1 nucleotide sugar dehydrogenase [Cyanobium sp. BA20m-14]